MPPDPPPITTRSKSSRACTCQTSIHKLRTRRASRNMTVQTRDSQLYASIKRLSLARGQCACLHPSRRHWAPHGRARSPLAASPWRAI
eukprot:2528058-Pleurochrysis_carterae.AAC.1